MNCIQRARGPNSPPRPIPFLIAALMILPLFPLTMPEAGAAGGGPLQISLFMANATMLWTEERDFSATVTFDGAPLMNATVNFTSTREDRWYREQSRIFRNLSNVTDRDGITTNLYRAQYAYSASDVITASVSYLGYNASANLSLIINNPPPDIIPGTDPRNANQMALLYGQSMMLAVLILVVAVAFRRYRMRKIQGPR